MEVLISMPAVDFNFDSGCSTPYMSVPSSPKPFGKFYYSAPTSPTRSSALYRDFNNISFIQRNRNRTTSYDDDDDDSQFNWDVEIDDNINSKDTHFDDQEEFAFDYSGQLEKTALTADELFDGGKIRAFNSSVSSPKSPKKLKKNSKGHEEEEEEGRGREKGSVFSTSRSKHRSTRSLSPLRLSEFVIEDQEQSTEPNSSIISKSSSFSFFTKWRLRDFLLFRSSSEGRATRRDPLKKYTSSMSRKHEEQRNSSFRSTDGSGSMRKGSGSGPQLYYTSNREVQDELKRKTYLPYRKGLLGCVGFNPTIDGLAKGLNSFRRG